MKLLENTQFEALSSALSVETAVSKINSRYEKSVHFFVIVN